MSCGCDQCADWGECDDAWELDDSVERLLDVQARCTRNLVRLGPMVGTVAMAGVSVQLARALTSKPLFQTAIVATSGAVGFYVYRRVMQLYKVLESLKRADRVHFEERQEASRQAQLEEAKKHTYKSTIALLTAQLDGVRNVQSVSVTENDVLCFHVAEYMLPSQVDSSIANFCAKLERRGVSPAGVLVLPHGVTVESVTRDELMKVLQGKDS